MRHIIAADLWLKRNAWRLFLALAITGLCLGAYAKSQDNPTMYAASSAARG